MERVGLVWDGVASHQESTHLSAPELLLESAVQVLVLRVDRVYESGRVGEAAGGGSKRITRRSHRCRRACQRRPQEQAERERRHQAVRQVAPGYNFICQHLKQIAETYSTNPLAPRAFAFVVLLVLSRHLLWFFSSQFDPSRLALSPPVVCSCVVAHSSTF